jgi:prepilin-type N-terminal cleavage/methylation domain-containing protein
MKERIQGFTLLELVVVLLIAGVLLGVGIPGMTSFIRNSRMTSAANDFIAALHLARTEAIKRRMAITACASSNPFAADEDDIACLSTGAASRQLNANNGWIVFVDRNGDGVRTPDADPLLDEVLLRQHAGLPAGIIARSSVTPLKITYLDNGFSGTFVDVDLDGKRDVVADVDTDGDGILDVDEDVDLDGNEDVIEPVIPTPASNVVFCDQRGNTASAGELSAARGISISATGRPQVTRDPDEITILLGDNGGGAIAGCN